MNTKNIFLTFGTLILIGGAVFFGCRQHSDSDLLSENGSKQTGQTLNKMANCGTCATISNPRGSCGTCITDNFMGNQTTKTSTIFWRECSTIDPTAEGQGCNRPIAFKSEVKFCYNDDPTLAECGLIMEIDQLPSCISCISSFPYCVKLKASCVANGNDYTVTLDDSDPNTPAIIEYAYTVIGGDPKITLCCTRKNSAGVEYQYCCTGEFQ